MSKELIARARRTEYAADALDQLKPLAKFAEDEGKRADAAEATRRWAGEQASEAHREAERQRIRCVDIGAELARFVIEHNVTHLDDCPEDDNCRCPHVERINRLLRDCPGEATDGQDKQIRDLSADLATVRLELATRTAQLQRSAAERLALADWVKEARPVVDIARKIQAIRDRAAADLDHFKEIVEETKPLCEYLSTMTLPGEAP